MDDPALADAVHLIRCDAAGIAMSHSGYAGLWETVLPITGDYLATREMRILDTDENLVLEISWDGTGMAVNGDRLATEEYVEAGFISKVAYEQEKQETAEKIAGLQNRVAALETLTENLQERIEALEQAGGETTK